MIWIRRRELAPTICIAPGFATLNDGADLLLEIGEFAAEVINARKQFADGHGCVSDTFAAFSTSASALSLAMRRSTAESSPAICSLSLC